jgi:hypothetical protein
MFRPVRVDHTNCLQVAIKTHSFIPRMMRMKPLFRPLLDHHDRGISLHTELSRLPFSAWRFICINNEKSFRTVWTELAQEFPEVFNHCAEQTLWNTARDSETFQMPTDTKSGVICLLEFKRMSDVTSHYIVRAKCVTVVQYESLRSALAKCR